MIGDVDVAETVRRAAAERASGIDQQLTLGDAVEGRFIVLRKGKRNYHLVQVDGAAGS